MNKRNKIGAYRKPVIIGAAAIAAVAALSVTVYAWFTNQRRLDTITKINAPTALSIGAGAKEDSMYIDMGGIDVDTGTYKDFVFCVFSDTTAGNYKIQLAHTTNIGFTYEIYKSEDNGDENNVAVLYTDQNGGSHYYTKGDQLGGAYINRDPVTLIAGDAYHEESYGAYQKEYVQKNAEPLYWQSDIIPPANTVGSGFVDYYILRVSWTAEVKNNKETDMVYITAGMS
ncbi:MAG: hypothetical protein ACI4KR_00470 [Ruminiclostridium sp.]